MAITVIKRPIGHKLDTNQQTGQIIDNGAGYALVYTGTAHGLSDGDYILLESNFDTYNGFKYVDSVAYDSFLISDSEESDPIEFVQNADITFYISVHNHGWQCVHLPIVYELQSDLYPTNIDEEDYLPITVVSQSDDNGYTRLALSKALTDDNVYSKIEIIGDGDLAGVYTITTSYQPWNVTINLLYDAGNSFSGYIIVKYYDNYAINVNVWAGLPSDHRWEARKPFEIAATLRFIPDASNQVKFSISEVLRAYINTRNNLTLDTLPNNLDFMVCFFIEYYETYDESDGEDITTHESNYSLDTYEGYAVNAMLEFKSESGSFLSEFVDDGGTNLARWLTLFESPVMIYGYFYDLSFISQYSNRDIIILKNGVEYLTIENPGLGVLRVPIEAELTDDQLCIEAWVGPGTELVPADEVDLSLFLNDAGTGSDWVLGENPSFDNATGSIYQPFLVPNGETITFHYEFVITTGDESPANMVFVIADDTAGGFGNSVNILIQDPGTYSGDVSITATANREYLVIACSHPFTDYSGFLVSIGYGEETEVEVPGFQVTEDICLTVIQDCEGTLTDDDARITEDSRFRLLE